MTTPLPLAGRTILDCSTLLPGPFIGKLLARKGARLIKIENPRVPDPARQWPIYFRDLNAMKETIALDLKADADRARFRELLKTAHGVIEGFRPSAKTRLGLDEKTLLAVNPSLCIVSLVGYPENGPLADRPGHDMNFGAVTGLLSLFNELPGLPLADLFGAYEGALSMAAALGGVSRGQPGRRISVSLTEVLTGIQSRTLAEYRETGKVPFPGSTLFSGHYPCYRLYRAGDGRRVTLGAIEHKFWAEACTRLGVPELAAKGYATGTEGEATAARIQAAFSSRPWQGHWDAVFADGGCCVEPVLDYSELDRGVQP